MSTEWIAGMRHAADLIEAHPDLPKPTVGDTGRMLWFLYPWQFEDGNAAPAVAAIRRVIGGKWDKREADGGAKMVFAREGYEVHVEREAVCIRRVVGTETVTLPAVEAQPERTVEREIVEWDCEPVLAAKAVAR